MEQQVKLIKKVSVTDTLANSCFAISFLMQMLNFAIIFYL